MPRERKRRWSWKVEDRGQNPDLNLLYEPGNWGDMLKGTWAVITVRAVLGMEPPGTFRYFDSFAGAPTYPLVEASRRRLEGMSGGPFVEAQERFTRGGELASTAMLVHESVKLVGADVRLEVFDADPPRRAKWASIPGAVLLDAVSGEEALLGLESRAERPHFILIDPYDFFDRALEILPTALPLARRSPVLFYAFNRAPRGGEYARKDRALKDALREGARELGPILVGRVPSDAGLARAYHEMILAAPAAITSAAAPALREATQALARRIAEEGAFEEIRG
jgi:hypothetical protein